MVQKTAKETNIPLHQRVTAAVGLALRGKPRVSVLLIWDNLGKASIKGDVLHIKAARCKAVAYTRSGCRFMLHPKSNEQHGSYLCFGGNGPFHHIDFLKHLEKSSVSCWHLGLIVMSLPGSWAWAWPGCGLMGEWDRPHSVSRRHRCVSSVRRSFARRCQNASVNAFFCCCFVGETIWDKKKKCHLLLSHRVLYCWK